MANRVTLPCHTLAAAMAVKISDFLLMLKVVFGEIAVAVDFVSLAVKQAEVMDLLAFLLIKGIIALADQPFQHVGTLFADVLDALDELVISLFEKFVSPLVPHLYTVVLLVLDGFVVYQIVFCVFALVLFFRVVSCIFGIELHFI